MATRRRRGRSNLERVTTSESFLRLTGPRKTPAERAAEESARKPKPKPPPFERILTLNQLRATVEEIYVSKQKYDLKCDEAQLPYETMEQHVYTYLNQKYGLKPIILGWLKAIKEAVKKFKKEDPDVQCFGKILSNDLHEGYLIDYHYNLKKKINQLLYTVVQIENPKSNDAQLSDLFDERVQNYLLEEEWTFMVRDVYNEEHDQKALQSAILSYIEEKRAPIPSSSSVRRRQIVEADPDPIIMYKEFVQIVLDFQLNGHVKFLRKFKRWFNDVWARQEDPKVPGVIGEEAFCELVKLAPFFQPDEMIGDMLNTIDPFETGKITFSQCASILMPLLIHLAEEEDAKANEEANEEEEEEEEDGYGYDDGHRDYRDDYNDEYYGDDGEAEVY